MSSRNKIIKGMLLSMTLITIMSAKSYIVEANNYKDTEFKEFYSGYNIVETGYRYKSDYTSAYIYNSGSPCSVHVDVWGAYCRNDENGKFISKPSTETCCNYSGTVIVGKGQSKKLLNSVRENGYNGAELRMTGSQIRVQLSGLWSPDSV